MRLNGKMKGLMLRLKRVDTETEGENEKVDVEIERESERVDTETEGENERVHNESIK